MNVDEMTLISLRSGIAQTSNAPLSQVLISKVPLKETDRDCWIEQSMLPWEVTAENYRLLWDLHPEKKAKIQLFGKTHDVPRYVYNYGKNYPFSTVNMHEFQEDTIPEWISPFIKYIDICEESQGRSGGYNQCLVNWYPNGTSTIGAHGDDERGLKENAPIYAISLGVPRKFRIRSKDKSFRKDLLTSNGLVMAMCGNMQKKYTHEIPKEKLVMGSRISLTFRKHA